MKHWILTGLGSLAIAACSHQSSSAATAAAADRQMTPSMTVVNQLMASAKVDFTNDVATLPLHLGHLADGRNVWFVLTDTNDPTMAKKYGLVTATQLNAVIGVASTRMATIDANGNFVFNKGTVDFSPKMSLVAGMAPNYFPPATAVPGSVGDADYSSFVQISGTQTVFNAPIVAFDVDASQIDFCNGNVDYDLVHDRVTNICPTNMSVSIKLGHGFAGGNPVIYMSFDSNNTLPATMESSTYAPAEMDLTSVGASETLYGFANGATGVNNPDRQGFDSFLLGEGPPLNILSGLTINSTGYTPLWDVNVAVWTTAAVNNGQRHLVTNDNTVAMDSQAGLLTNPSGGAVGTLGLLVNCPVIGFVK